AKLGKEGASPRFEAVEPAVGQPRDRTDRQIELPHEFLRRGDFVERRDFLLSLETELIVVAPTEVMQETADLEQDRHTRGEFLVPRPELREPAQHLEIAQTAGRVLDVGFEMVNRAVELRVTLLGELDDIAPEFRARIAHLAEEFLISGEQAAIKQADGQFGIARIDLVAIGGGVDRLADTQAFIPEIAKDERQRLFDRELHFFIRGQDEKIDVRIRKELSAAVAADGHQCDFGRNPLPPLPYDVVDARCAARQNRGRVECREEMFADFLLGHSIHFSWRMSKAVRYDGTGYSPLVFNFFRLRGIKTQSVFQVKSDRLKPVPPSFAQAASAGYRESQRHTMVEQA